MKEFENRQLTVSDLHGPLGFVLGVVRHVRHCVEELSDAVSAIGGDHRAARRLTHPGDLIAQISESKITG